MTPEIRSEARRLRAAVTAAALALVAFALGCAQPTPEQKVTAARALYKVERVSFRALPPPAPPAPEVALEGDATASVEPAPVEPAPVEPATVEPATAEPAPADGEAPEIAAAEPAPPPKTTIFFDVILSFDGREPLPGVTLDITQADPFEKVKAVRRHYVETSSIGKGSPLQLGFELPDWDFAEGDLFSVELGPVPEGARGDYREYAEAR